MELAQNYVIATVNNRYQTYDTQYQIGYNRRCIDGRITGCGKCVGYCQYEGHPGFLTQEHRKHHNCLNKKCFYYVAKEKESRIEKTRIPFDPEIILHKAQQLLKSAECLKVIRVTEEAGYGYTLHFISITNDYSLTEYAVLLSDEFNCQVQFQRLNYSFDVCCTIIMSDYEKRRGVH